MNRMHLQRLLQVVFHLIWEMQWYLPAVMWEILMWKLTDIPWI